MDMTEIQSLIRDMIGDTKPRKPHKFWVPYAWTVRVLVEGGMGISQACKEVMKMSGGKEDDEHALNCLRVVYYKIRDRKWPEEMRRRLRLSEEEPVGEGLDEPVSEEPTSEPVEEVRSEPVAPTITEEVAGDFDPDADPDYVPEDFEV